MILKVLWSVFKINLDISRRLLHTTDVLQSYYKKNFLMFGFLDIIQPLICTRAFFAQACNALEKMSKICKKAYVYKMHISYPLIININTLFPKPVELEHSQ